MVMSDETWDRIGEGLFWVAVWGVIVALIFGIFLGVNAINANSCRDRTALYNLEFVDYGWNTGCTIKTENGTLTNLDLYLTTRDGN